MTARAFANLGQHSEVSLRFSASSSSLFLSLDRSYNVLVIVLELERETSSDFFFRSVQDDEIENDSVKTVRNKKAWP